MTACRAACLGSVLFAVLGCASKSNGNAQADGGATSSSGGALSNGGSVSPGGAAMASNGGSTPANGGAMPANGGSTSSNAGATSSSGGQAFDSGACPTVAPFDDSDQAVIDNCTVPVVVAIGNGLRRAVSLDGQTWDHEVYLPDPSLSDQNENSHRDALIAKGLIFIVGDGGVLVSSDRGSSFTVSHAGRFHDSGLAYFQDAIWVVSNLGTYATSDGKAWQEWPADMTLPGGLPGAFGANAGTVVGGSKLLTVSNRSEHARVFDGTTWTEQTFGADYGSLSGAAFGNGTFLILGDACCDKSMFAGLRATSLEATTWTVQSNATSATSPNLRFGDVVWDGTRFLASASQYDKRTYVSSNGLDWEARDTNVAIGPLTSFEGAYLGAQSAVLYRSTDGITWNMTQTGIGDQKWGFNHLRAGHVLR